MLIDFRLPKERARKARMTIKRARVRTPTAKERKGKKNRKEKKVITVAKAKTKKGKVWQHVTLVGGQDILLETVGETIFDRLQVIQPIHLQEEQANVSQQSSSAETKPVIRRIENSEPIIIDLREGHDEAEDHGNRVIQFYIGDADDDVDADVDVDVVVVVDDDDDDEPCGEGGNLIEENSMEIENEEPKVRRLGEESY